jgi:hypothetical protein
MCGNTRNLFDLSNSPSNDLTGGKGISHSELMSWGGTCLLSRCSRRFQASPVQIRPPQPKLLLCQSLPQTLQPSEFAIFIVKDIENSSPTPRSTPIRGQIISGLRRDSGRTRTRAILFASTVEVLLVSCSVLGSIPIPIVRCRLWPVFSRR